MVNNSPPAQSHQKCTSGKTNPPQSIVDDPEGTEEDNNKPVSKKRGRKPKGGKIVQQIQNNNIAKTAKPNIILHLKCYLSDLNAFSINAGSNINPPQMLNSGVCSSSSVTNIESYNYDHINELYHDVLSKSDTTNAMTFLNGNTSHGIGSSSLHAHVHSDSCKHNINQSYETSLASGDVFDVYAQKALLAQNSSGGVVGVMGGLDERERERGCEVVGDYSMKEVWKKLKKLEHDLHINNISDKKSACFWDTCDFDSPPIYIPKHFIKDSYQVYGCFCSPECAVAYLMNENIDSSIKFERYHLLNHIYAKIFNYTKNIKPAPIPHYMLEKFYGNLHIQEFRGLSRTERLFLIVDKPLTRILPELHEDNDDFILNNKIIPTNNTQLKKSGQRKTINKNNIVSENFGLAK